jgi:hypothetical protein
METALEAFARQADVSLIVEGQPPRRPYRSGEGGAARDVVTQLAEAYDYSWETSRTGVVLFRKRFTDEHSWPELSLPELQACMGDVAAVIRRMVPRQEGNPSMQMGRRLEELVAVLPPAARERMAGEGLPVLALPPDAQQAVLSTIFDQAVGGLAWQWNRLESLVRNAPMLSIGPWERASAPKGAPRPLFMMFPPGLDAYTTNPVHLSATTIQPRANLDVNDPAPHPALETSLTQAWTVAEASRVLGGRLGAVIDVAPELHGRRLLLLAQPANASNALSALADLHGWSVSFTKTDEQSVYRVRRTRLGAVTRATEIGRAIREGLPRDVARAILISPKRMDGAKVHLPVDIEHGLTNDPGYFGIIIQMKFARQADAVREVLRASLPAGADVKPVHYRELTDPQKLLVLKLLFASSQSDGVSTFRPLIGQFSSWVLDPSQARIYSRGGGLGIGGANGPSWGFRRATPFGG